MKKLISMLFALTIAVMSVCTVPASQGATVPAYTMNQGLVSNLDLMTEIMNDIDRIFKQGNITLAERQQLVKIMADVGGVMQKMGASPEIEGWQLTQQQKQLTELKFRLDALKKSSEPAKSGTGH